MDWNLRGRRMVNALALAMGAGLVALIMDVALARAEDGTAAPKAPPGVIVEPRPKGSDRPSQRRAPKPDSRDGGADDTPGCPTNNKKLELLVSLGGTTAG
jgi:hypothetical protein